MSRGAVLRTVGPGVVGALLLLVAIGLAFLRPQIGRALAELDPGWLTITSWAGLNLVAWAALAGGAWLVGVAWQRWRRAEPEPDSSQA